MRILIDGPVLSLNSAALVNRQIALGLLSSGHEVFITPGKGNETAIPSSDEEEKKLRPLIREVEGVDVCIRNSWPPDLSPPHSGRWVAIQPWEFGSLPKKWAEVFSRDVDEMWVPTHYVREVYIDSGVSADRVYVVPNGIDPQIFSPDANPYRLKTSKRFKFLFVGGAIPRKGIDLLINAYLSTYTSSDDVCLVIKDFGASSFYGGMTFRDQIIDLMKRPGVPEIEYIDADLRPEELAGLYVACDVLVHPYRGEGFGLPILEAMACGTPPMLTDGGAALDFCNDENSILVKASIKVLTEKQVFGMETVDFPSIFKADMDDLKMKLKWAPEHEDDLKILGFNGGRIAREKWTWRRSASVAAERIHELMEKVPVRSRKTTISGSAHQESQDLVGSTPNNKESTMDTRNSSNLAPKSREIQSMVDPQSRFILDVGCADGELAGQLKQKLDAEVWGIEIDETGARASATRIDKVLLGRVEDGIAELPNNYFDTIIFANVLEYLQDPHWVLREMKTKLAPQGEIIASIPNSRHWSVLRKLIEDKPARPENLDGEKPPLSLFTRQGVVEMFRQAGYNIVDMKATIAPDGGIPDGLLNAFESAGLRVSVLREEHAYNQFLIKSRATESQVKVHQEKGTDASNGKAEPKGSFLTSIVIPVYNQRDYTAITLESVRKFTTVPYEIIVVDNGSDDETRTFLERQDDITLIRNERNLGFPQACNQGMAAAAGRYVVLLNNDVFVSEEWLTGLLECAESDDKIGIVGPMTNYISGPQMYRNASYRDISEMSSFAVEFRQANRRNWTEFPRITGFCMLIKRELIEKIGGLDSEFGIGNCEDDDYSLRSNLAGFKNVIAGDVFIHHFGSKTFQQAGVETLVDRIQVNEKIFEEKWGVSPSEWWREGKSPSKQPDIFIPLYNENAILTKP